MITFVPCRASPPKADAFPVEHARVQQRFRGMVSENELAKDDYLMGAAITMAIECWFKGQMFLYNCFIVEVIWTNGDRSIEEKYGPVKRGLPYIDDS